MKIKGKLSGECVRLRSYEKEDLPFCMGIWLDEENGRYLSDPTADFVDAVYQKALDNLQDREDVYYLMVETKDGDRVGTCFAAPDEQGLGFDIGYCIEKHCWKQGYGTETLHLLIDWIRKLGGKWVTAEVAIENLGSIALLEKCGFVLEKESEFQKYNMDIRFPSRCYRLEL